MIHQSAIYLVDGVWMQNEAATVLENYNEYPAIYVSDIWKQYAPLTLQLTFNNGTRPVLPSILPGLDSIEVFMNDWCT